MQYNNLADMFWSQAKRYGDRTALKHKVNGTWTPVSWNEWADLVKKTASGLAALGLEKGDRVGILSQNRVEWVTADLATICAGGVTVGIYASNLPKEVAYVAGHAESPFIFVENREQLEKVLEVRSELPRLKKIIVYDMPSDFENPDVMSMDELMNRGADKMEEGETRMEDVRRNVSRDEMALLIYTSGTTGPPKGAMLSHHNILWTADMGIKALNIGEDDETLSFLPLAHLLEHFLFFGTIMLGATINFAESIDKVAQNMREVRPTVVVGVPRVYEKIYARLQNMADEKGKLASALFKLAKDSAIEYARKKSRGRPVGPGLGIRHKIGDIMVFRKLRGIVGGNIRFFGSGGAPLSAEIAEFFYGAGLPIIEAWGMTETTAPVTVTRPDKIRPGAVGSPLPGDEVRIADDGEILVKGPNVFMGYFKNPEATREALKDGWMHTGDVGYFDEEGILHITDRKKDLIITAGGKNIAPQNIENMIKTDPIFSQIVLIGDRRPYCVALFTLNEEEVRRLAGDKGLDPNMDYVQLVKKPEIIREVDKALAEKNKLLARYEQIKKYRIIPYDFSQETGELTPTMKVKRKVVNEKFKDLIEEMYRADA